MMVLSLYRRRGGVWLLLVALLLLAACNGGPVRQVFTPSASIQQLSVTHDGQWQVQLRLRNYSTVAMHFKQIQMQARFDHDVVIALNSAPDLSISADSADIVSFNLQPDDAARLLVADSLADGRTLSYELKGYMQAVPEGRRTIWFQVENSSHLNPTPGLPGVLR